MACTVEPQIWSPHRLAGSPYVPRGISSNRYSLSSSRRGSAPEDLGQAIKLVGQNYQSKAEETISVKPKSVSKIMAPSSILKVRGSSRGRSRHIVFKNEALVHHLGDLGEYLYSNLENVNFEPKPQNLYHRLSRSPKFQKSALSDSTNRQLSYDDMNLKRSQTVTNAIRSSRSGDASEKDSTISFSRDACGNLTMCLSVFVGKEHNPKDVLVKACTSGRKLRVISGSNSQNSRVPPFLKDISLPMEIESLSIKAKMDPKGFLAIEGNVKDMSMKSGTL